MGQVIHIDIEARRQAAERIIDEVARALSCNNSDTVLKQSIIAAYCDGEITQETAMRLIAELGLKHA